MKRKLIKGKITQGNFRYANISHTEDIFKVIPIRHINLIKREKFPFQLTHKHTILEIFKQT
jgi:hypothetical protein